MSCGYLNGEVTITPVRVYCLLAKDLLCKKGARGVCANVEVLYEVGEQGSYTGETALSIYSKPSTTSLLAEEVSNTSGAPTPVHQVDGEWGLITCPPRHCRRDSASVR